MKIYKVKSFAKINLVLYVTGKLTKLHKIESIVKFIELHDLISIKRTKSNKHKISFNGRFSKDIKKDQSLIHTLMGDDVALRKDFIISNAINVQNLDI